MISIATTALNPLAISSANLRLAQKTNISLALTVDSKAYSASVNCVALRLIRDLHPAIRQKPGSAFVLVTPHGIFTIAEICERTKQHLTVEEFLSPNPLVVILEQTVAQRQPPQPTISAVP